MQPRIRRLLGWAAAQVPTLLVLAALGGLALWGSHNDWKLPTLSAPKGDKDGDNKGDAKGKKEEENVLHRVKLDDDDTAAKAGIKWGPAEERPLVRYVTAVSVLQYNQNRYAHLSTRAPGMVWSVAKGAGDAVKKGDVLALVAAEAVAKAKADYQQALVQVGVRQNIIKSMVRAEDAIPPRQMAAAQADLRNAEVRLRGADQALLNLGLDVRAEELAALPDAIAARRLQVLGLPDDVVQNDGARLPSSLLPLRAPFDGMVIRRDMVKGEVLTSSSPPQFVVADVHTLWLMLDVRPPDDGELKPGQEVDFTPERGGETVRGTLKWVSPEVDPKTRTVRARAEVPNPDLRFRPNTFGRTRVHVGVISQAVAVPAEAVQTFEVDPKTRRSVSVVFVRKSDTEFEPREVQPREQDGGWQYLRGGLRAGEVVVTAGSHRLLSEMLKSRIGGED